MKAARGAASALRAHDATREAVVLRKVRDDCGQRFVRALALALKERHEQEHARRDGRHDRAEGL
jgi:hypothetical protein